MTSVPSPAPRRRSLLLVLGTGVALTLGLGGWIAVKVGQKQAEEADRAAERARTAASSSRATPVAVATPEAATWTPEVVLTGTLEPIQAADLAFEVGGRILRVDARLGDHVEAGQAIATLDRGTIGAQQAQTAATVSAAQAQLSIAADRLARVETLRRTGSAAEAELFGARQGVALAEAQLAQARATRRLTSTASADHVLRAPFAGLLTRVPAGPGGVVGPGVPVVRVEDLSSLRLRGSVSEDDLSAVRVGATVAIEGSRATGTVRALVRSLDPATRRAPIEVSVPNADDSLVGNAHVRAHVRTGDAVRALRIPASARRTDGTVAVVGARGRVTFRRVTAHVGDDGAWLVTDGLTETDRVVVRPSDRLEEGATVPVAAVPGVEPQASNAPRPR